MKVNYHTHTSRCHHAIGRDEDYVKAAIQAGFKEIGFTDHCPWPFDGKYKSHMRMQPGELDDYIFSLLTLQDKYKDQISIKIGLECEYFPNQMKYIQRILRYKPIDYIILGNHFHFDEQHGYYFGRNMTSKKQLTAYVDDAIEGLKTGLYSYLAHPDLVDYVDKNSDEYKEEMTRLILACKEMNKPLEFNLLGYYEGRHYPCDTFWKLASKYQSKAIIGYDAHDPKRLLDDNVYQKAIHYLHDLGLEIVEEISFLK